ncbi:type II toxin-antitoxin system PemK/MazF family toxin [Chamaesiphon sp.]|uniref:type II toxin-antitoxin system PemK/MazF family toxin n=1 Tax=Chamaesiphon sp. TaxID=2814140 RepID=UPI00359367C0
MTTSYIPNRGDIVYLDFNPTKGHEQRGYRPALIISPAAYSDKSSLALFCPITSQQKGYPFEVLLPEDLQTLEGDSGAVTKAPRYLQPQNLCKNSVDAVVCVA